MKHFDGCEHVLKMKNYLRRNKLAIEGEMYPELSVYCGICEEYFEAILDVSSWVEEEEEE
jgi:hypothetical protein